MLILEGWEVEGNEAGTRAVARFDKAMRERRTEVARF